MRNIRKFETFDDFLASQESVSGSGNYVQDIWPGFAYIKEKFPEAKYAVYNGEDSEEYEFGDIIYYDGSDKLKKAYWSAFTPSMGEKVGLVVVPTALAPDGNARIMAFGSIVRSGMTPSPEVPVANAAKPGEGDAILGKTAVTSYEKVYPNWYNNFMDENQTVYTCLPGFYLEGDGGGGAPKAENSGLLTASVPGNEGQPTHYESPVSLPGLSWRDPLIFSSDAHYMYPNPYTNGEYYNTGDTLVAISPFLGNSLKEQDPAYLQEELQGGSLPSGGGLVDKGKASLGGGNYNAFSDFSGYTWTYGCPPERENEEEESRGNMRSSQPVGPVLGAYFPHNYARLFHTDGTQEGDWYLPSMGEMGFFIARYKMIVEEIIPYLYSVGAWASDGSDNIPGLNNTGESQYSYGLIWISTVGARSGGVGPIYTETAAASPALLGASIPGGDTFPTVYPMVATVIAERLIGGDDGGSVVKSANPNVLGATSNQLRYNVQASLNYYNGGSKAAPASSNPYEVLPFAMIKEGKIQRTMGDYTAANGHQVKDFYAGGGERE